MTKKNICQGISAITLVALALFHIEVTHAADDATTTATPDSPKQKVKESPDIPVLVVTGTRNQSAILPTDTDPFGLSMSQLDTPRSTSSVSKAMIDQYSLTTVRDLIAVAPGTFTASFYGVDGTPDIRGEYADNFFRGFKRVENQGTYVTPLDSSLDLDIVRGIASPQYGTGRAGGYVNFDPRSDRSTRFMNGLEAQGEASAAAGDYNYYRDTLEWGTPLSLGSYRAGIDAYVEVNQSEQYFNGIDPRHKLAQLGFSTELPGGWQMNLGGQYLTGSGMQGTTGVNRLTQALVDNGTYTSGRPIAQIAPPGAAYITPADINAIGGITQYYAYSNAYSTLDPSTIRYVPLNRHDVLVSPYDFGIADTTTGYLDLIHSLGSGQIKLQAFHDQLTADSYNGYGFAKSLRDVADELRFTYLETLDSGSWFHMSMAGGATYRRYHADEGYDYALGYMDLDRQDITVGATPDSIFDPRYITGAPWDQFFHSTVEEYGAFYDTHIDLFHGLMFTGGGRFDEYHAKAINDGLLDYSVNLNQLYERNKGAASWSASLSYATPWGLVPYITRGRSFALETSQGGAVAPGDVSGNTFLSPTTLTEGGLKGSFFDSRLFVAIADYAQTRVQQQLLGGTFVGATTRGLEGELRWAINHNFAISAVSTRQRTYIAGSTYLDVTPQEIGLANTSGWGFLYEAGTNTYPGLAAGYIDRTQPHYVFGLFGNYEEGNGLGATLGGNYVDKTSGELPGAVVFPQYYLMRGSVHFDWSRYRVALNVNNILDKRYYIPQRSVETEGSAMPGEGRTLVLKFTAQF